MHISHTQTYLPQLQLAIYMRTFKAKSQDETIVSVVQLAAGTPALSPQVNAPLSAIGGTCTWACKTHESRERWCQESLMDGPNYVKYYKVHAHVQV